MGSASVGLLNEKYDELWWNDGDAFRSRLFDAISLLLPAGEQFVITAMSDWLQGTLRDSTAALELQAEVQRFVREEVAHSRAHRLYNRQLAKHAPALRLEQRIMSVMEEMANWDLPTRIAMAAAFEYLTALLSEEALRTHNAWLGANTTPQMRLWRWHCQEEIAHRHVALQVMQAMGTGHFRRASSFIVAATYLGLDLSMLLATLLWSDLRKQHIGKRRLGVQAARFALRVFPSLFRMLWGGLRYIVRTEP